MKVMPLSAIAGAILVASPMFSNNLFIRVYKSNGKE